MLLSSFPLHWLSASQFYMLFLLAQVTSARFGPTNMGGNGTFPLLADATGGTVANAHIEIDLVAYEKSVSPLTEKRDNLASWFNISYIDPSKLQTNDPNDLEKRTDIHACATWIKGAGQCVNDIWDGLSDIWNIAFKIKQLATAKQCTEIHGQQGGMYYRYWASGGDCGTTADQKTIAGAIDAVLRKLEGEWDCNIYCIRMTHGGSWVGTLLIGSNSDAMYASCSGQFKGCYDAGCNGLTGWYNCNS